MIRLVVQRSGAVWTGRWAWALIPYPIIPPVPNKSYGFCGRTAAWKEKKSVCIRAQELCEQGRGLGSHSLSHSSPVPNKSYGFCGRTAAWKMKKSVCVSAWALIYSLSHFPPSLINHTVSVDAQQQERWRSLSVSLAWALIHSLSHSSPVPNKPHSFSARVRASRKKKNRPVLIDSRYITQPSRSRRSYQVETQIIKSHLKLGLAVHV